MKEIKYIAERIREELEDAEGYAKHALKYKDGQRDFANALADLAKQELAHSEILHTQAVRFIKAQREVGIVPPAAMQAVWDWEHELMIEKSAHIKHLLDMLRQ
jgi:hypothetical protein